MTGDPNPNELIGTQLGSCVLERIIGIGGMGAVYLAQQTRPHRQVAVKVVLPGHATSPDAWHVFLARFAREADVAANLDHANIVPIYEFGQQDETAFLVMPYLADGSLADLLLRRGRLPLGEAVAYVEQAAAALDHAHQRGLVHRDVKPSNLLLHPDGRLMLADFGIARPADPVSGGTSGQAGATDRADPQRSESGRPAGTPEYMAPEQIQAGPLTPATDVYALGIVAYAMLAGQSPFADQQPHLTLARQLHETPPSLRALRPDVPARAEEAIMWALAKDPAARPQSAGAFAMALRRAAARSRPLSSLFARGELTGGPRNEAVAEAPRGLLRLAGMLSGSPEPVNASRVSVPSMAGAPLAAVPPNTPAYVPPSRRDNGTRPLSQPGASSISGASVPSLPANPLDPPPLPASPLSGLGSVSGMYDHNSPTIFDAGAYQRAAPGAWPSPVRPASAMARPRRSFSALKYVAAGAVAAAGMMLLLMGVNNLLALGGPNGQYGGLPAASPLPTATELPTPTATIPANWLSVSPTSVSLQCKGRASSQQLTISNQGDQSLDWHIEAQGLSGMNFSKMDGTIPAGSSTRVTVSNVSWWSQKGSFTIVPDTDGAGDPATVTYSLAGCFP